MDNAENLKNILGTSKNRRVKVQILMFFDRGMILCRLPYWF